MCKWHRRICQLNAGSGRVSSDRSERTRELQSIKRNETGRETHRYILQYRRTDGRTDGKAETRLSWGPTFTGQAVGVGGRHCTAQFSEVTDGREIHTSTTQTTLFD